MLFEMRRVYLLFSGARIIELLECSYFEHYAKQYISQINCLYLRWNGKNLNGKWALNTLLIYWLFPQNKEGKLRMLFYVFLFRPSLVVLRRQNRLSIKIQSKINALSCQVKFNLSIQCLLRWKPEENAR